ncbi:hypothetical protein [Streptomyces ardesiacus]|uniref:hypothetical protein n=1 Tax=Streptomyces ardesiacus TaxID=285564 RepID=UPI00365F8FFD
MTDTIITTLTATHVPALGDIRDMGPEDHVVVHPDTAGRTDWPRIWEALGVAYVRGASVSLLWRA